MADRVLAAATQVLQDRIGDMPVASLISVKPLGMMGPNILRVNITGVDSDRVEEIKSAIAAFSKGLNGITLNPDENRLQYEAPISVTHRIAYEDDYPGRGKITLTRDDHVIKVLAVRIADAEINYPGSESFRTRTPD